MARETMGRTLDHNGRPQDKTGFEYDGESRLVELLRQRSSPIFSQPQTGEWVFGLVASADTNGEFERGVGVFRPGNAGPPEHIHPTYDEHFEVVEGTFIFRMNGEERPVSAGDKFVVKKGTPHTFRCTGDEFGVVVVESRPAARTGYVIATLFGMAHEGRLSTGGHPHFLQAMVIASEYADDTVFTTPPPAVVLRMAKALSPLGRLLGYQATDPRYIDDAFWSRTVEQPAVS